MKTHYPADESALYGLGDRRGEFETWMAELETAHIKVDRPYGGRTLAQMTGIECWIGFFEDGFTPEEALEEDLSNAK